MDNSLNQGSAEWLALRKTKITSTDSATILGINPYCSAYTLWQRKQDLILEQEQTARMALGNQLEPEARASFIALTGIEVEPRVVFHKTNDWQMASLDGVSSCGKYAAEFKCSKKIFEKALNNDIDPMYLCQCNHHMACLDIPMIYFYAYWDGKGKLIEINRDEAFIKDMIDKEYAFYQSLKSFTAPEPDYIKIDDNNLISLASETMEAQRQSTYWKKQYEQLKDKLVEVSGRTSSLIGDYRLTKSCRPGNVDYSAIPALKEIDVNLFRKAPIESWRISEV